MCDYLIIQPLTSRTGGNYVGVMYRHQTHSNWTTFYLSISEHTVRACVHVERSKAEIN